jgi:hypothetical protein
VIRGAQSGLSGTNDDDLELDRDARALVVQIGTPWSVLFTDG